MPNIYEGDLIGTGLKVGVVVSRFNSFITTKLLDGALDSLKRHGVDQNDVDICWTPGSFEIPATGKTPRRKRDDMMRLSVSVRSFVARPRTFDFVANESAKGDRASLFEHRNPRDLRRYHHRYN